MHPSKMGACTSKTLLDNPLEEFREKISRMLIGVFFHFTLLIFFSVFYDVDNVVCMSASKGERNSFVTDWSVLDQGSAIFGPQPKISLPSVGMAHMLTIALTFLKGLKVNTIVFTFFKGEKKSRITMFCDTWKLHEI